MPSLTLDDNNAQYQIRAYAPGTITINDKTLSRSIIITPTQLIEDWAPQSIAELTTESLQVIADTRPDIFAKAQRTKWNKPHCLVGIG